MPAKKATRKTTARKASRKKAKGQGVPAVLKRLEHELPPTLAQYSRRTRIQLTRLERQIEKAEVKARRRFTRVLRDASHRLGHYEALGEKQWKKLTTQARRDAVKVLQKLEKAVSPPPVRKKAKKKSVRRKKSVQLTSPE